MIRVITENRHQSTGKSVLLFSGGLDSICIDKLLNPDLLLYIPSGAVYEDIETKKIQQMCDKNYIDKSKLIILSDTLNLATQEREDAIVPNRNAYFILLASVYGEKIILGVVEGDQTLLDKDKIFLKHMRGLLNHMWQESYWTEKREFSILSPFSNATKTELVRQYLDAGGDSKILLESYSCHNGQEIPCGVCKPCFRKHVALANNEIVVDGYFENHFWETDWFKVAWPKIQTCQYKGRSDLDTIEFITKNKLLSAI
jgi:7-cyano-7-deazaguanine synthase in queuosine biosynthesis